MLTPNSSMTSEKYNILIEKVTREIGQTDILIVDGLSMMGGKGTETENYSKNSKELKELAKKWNILVLLIAHASRGAELTTRGLERHVRGSEKVMDNADWSMTMSMIKQGTEIYDQSHGVYRLWNKRGSGNIVEGVYQFNPIQLLMEDTNLAPSDIQVYCELE